MKDNVEHDVLGAIERLDSWIEKNSWSGWDPYDIRGLPIFLKIARLPQSFPFNYIRGLVFKAVDYYPKHTRIFFNVKPDINSKAIGLLLSSYCNLFQATGKEQYLIKAMKCASWLTKNRNKNCNGFGWGYPFDWQTHVLIPKGTPSGIASVTVGDGFFRLYQITKEDKYLDICLGICEFFLKDLNITYSDELAQCFSYTPVDDFQVHNINLFIGEFLTRIGQVSKDSQLQTEGIRCGNFALKEQRPEGFIPYWGLSQTDDYSYGKIHTDHFHSGFEIRALYGIWKNTEDERFKNAYTKYFKWYLKNLFDDNLIPKFTPKSKFPIDIHSCAEAILCLSTIYNDNPNQKENLLKIIQWVIDTMEYNAGEYKFLISRKIPFIGNRHVEFPMIRWGQGWMIRALSQAYLTIKD
jgi:hypothetical protein